MRIPLDTECGIPLYRQIALFMEKQISQGLISQGQKLPSSRDLAASLGINRITVTTAYSELESKGLIASKAGSGTYAGGPGAVKVIEEAAAEQWKPVFVEEVRWESVFSRFSPLLSDIPRGFIDFASGTSDTRLFPLEDFRKALNTVLIQDGVEALGYGDRRGYGPFRETIASILSTQGIPAREDNILVTSGAQQAAFLIARCFLKPGDSVVTEAPTYSGIIDLFRSRGVNIISVKGNTEERYAEDLEKALRRNKPKLIYVIPNFNSPNGGCMSGELRRHLLSLALGHGVPIVEDDYVGDFRFEGKALPALKALDKYGIVIYIRTFSKILVPGLRTGFMAAEKNILEKAASEKRVQDLMGCELIQRALTRFITVGRYHAHLRRSLRVYRRRRDKMESALRQYFPDDFTWSSPQGGIFLWTGRPGKTDHDSFLRKALARGVGFAPGFLFDPAGGEDWKIRLNFAAYTEAELDKGLRILGSLYKEEPKNRLPATH